ncbi:MAG: CotH kinase family protein, partial [Methanocorpusculum sp.]|nr:CotH kinase family protein [Methanocorpusculum sp.]
MKQINKITIILVIFAVVFVGLLYIGALSAEHEASNEPYVSAYFDPDTVNTVKITMSDDNWNDMLENPLEEEYRLCSIEINGDTYDGVGIRPKGNMSLSMVASSDSDRYSFKVKSDEYVTDQTFKGLTKFVLNNCIDDATYMKECLSYQMMTELGVPTPLFSYAAVYINGEYYGLYLMLETVEDDFAQRNFGADYGNLYKPETMRMGGSM